MSDAQKEIDSLRARIAELEAFIEELRDGTTLRFYYADKCDTQMPRSLYSRLRDWKRGCRR